MRSSNTGISIYKIVRKLLLTFKNCYSSGENFLFCRAIVLCDYKMPSCLFNLKNLGKDTHFQLTIASGIFQVDLPGSYQEDRNLANMIPTRSFSGKGIIM